jgi:hypothetical protein
MGQVARAMATASAVVNVPENALGRLEGEV